MYIKIKQQPNQGNVKMKVLNKTEIYKNFARRAAVIALAAVPVFTSCKSDHKDDPKPKYNIAKFDFLPVTTQRPKIKQIDSAFAAGADSVYITSTEDWDYAVNKETGIAFVPLASSIQRARDDALDYMRHDSIARIKMSGIVNPTIEADSVIRAIDGSDVGYTKRIFTEAGFTYMPGYTR